MISSVPVDHTAPADVRRVAHGHERRRGGGVAHDPVLEEADAAGAWVRLAKANATRGKRMPTNTTSPSRISRPAAITISSRSVKVRDHQPRS